MKKCGSLDSLDQPFISDSNLLCPSRRLRLNSSYMAVRHLILCVDRHRQRFNGRQIQGVELFNVLVCIFDALHRCLESEVQDQKKWDDYRNEPEINCAVVAN